MLFKKKTAKKPNEEIKESKEDPKTEEVRAKVEGGEDEEEPKKMGKVEFWVRAGLFFAIAIVAPITYLAIAYGIFDVRHGESVSLSGWGIIGLVVLAVTIISTLNQVKKGLSYGNMFRQCLEGYSALIPLVVFIIILNAVEDNVGKLKMFLIFLAICEAIAVPINPLRKWAEQNNLEMAENFLMKCIKRAIGKK